MRASPARLIPGEDVQGVSVSVLHTITYAVRCMFCKKKRIQIVTHLHMFCMQKRTLERFGCEKRLQYHKIGRKLDHAKGARELGHGRACRVAIFLHGVLEDMLCKS